MLSRLQLMNFKSFSEATEVPLAPLTLIFGANSSGKSALIQALALYGQSEHTSRVERRRSSSWTWAGSHVDLGGFENVIFEHDNDLSMTIGLEYTESATRRGRISGDFRDPVDVAHVVCTVQRDDNGIAYSSKSEVGFNGDYSFDLLASRSDSPRSGLQIDPQTFREILRLKLSEFDSDLIDKMAAGMTRQELVEIEDQVDAALEASAHLAGVKEETIEEALQTVTKASDVMSFASTGPLPFFTGVTDDLHSINRGLDTPEQFGVAALIRDFIVDLISPISKALQDMVYVGPIRAEPQRVERFHNQPGIDYSPDGRGTTGRLFRDSKLTERVNRSLRVMEIPYEINAEKISNAEYPTVGDFLALRLTDLRTDVPVSLADVGYGISQLLPIVTEAESDEAGPLLIEQPELHLHPRLQGKMAEILANASHQRQIIAETHSENMVLRVQTLIRRGDLDPDDVSVLCVGADSDSGAGSWVVPIEFGAAGEMLQEWPGGFFEDRLEDY